MRGNPCSTFFLCSQLQYDCSHCAALAPKLAASQHFSRPGLCAQGHSSSLLQVGSRLSGPGLGRPVCCQAHLT